MANCEILPCLFATWAFVSTLHQRRAGYIILLGALVIAGSRKSANLILFTPNGGRVVYCDGGKEGEAAPPATKNRVSRAHRGRGAHFPKGTTERTNWLLGKGTSDAAG